MKLDNDSIERIGVWSIRAILAIGAVYCAATGKKEEAGAIAAITIISFLLL